MKRAIVLNIIASQVLIKIIDRCKLFKEIFFKDLLLIEQSLFLRVSFLHCVYQFNSIIIQIMFIIIVQILLAELYNFEQPDRHKPPSPRVIIYKDPQVRK